MPSKPPKCCSSQGCPGVTYRRFCDACEKRHNKAHNADRKHYKTAKHRNDRQAQLIKQPFCEWPMDDDHPCNKIATICDHVIPRSRGGEDSEHNYQSLCKPHHDHKTWMENNGRLLG